MGVLLRLCSESSRHIRTDFATVTGPVTCGVRPIIDIKVLAASCVWRKTADEARAKTAEAGKITDSFRLF